MMVLSIHLIKVRLDLLVVPISVLKDLSSSLREGLDDGQLVLEHFLRVALWLLLFSLNTIVINFNLIKL